MKIAWALALAGLMAAVPPVCAQTQAVRSEPAPAEVGDATAGDVLRAMRARLDGVETPDAQPRLTEGRLVHVTLLDAGAPLGRGTADAWPEALERALREARGNLPRGSDALQQAAQERRLAGALLSVEVGRPPVALGLAAISEVDWEVRAGLEGLAVTPPAGAKTADGAGPMVATSVFPSEMASRFGTLGGGQSPAQALVAAISEASGDPALVMAGVPGKELGDLIKSGWAIERFGVEHAVELVRGGPAVTLTRGAAPIPESAITLDGLRSWRDKLRAHVASRVAISEQPSGLRYTMASWINPQLGSAQESSDRTQTHLAAFALAQSHPDLAEGLLRTSVTLLSDRPGERRTFTPVERATFVRAALALPTESRDRLLADARATLEQPGTSLADLLDAEGGWKQDVPASHRGLIAWGYSGASDDPALEAGAGECERAVRSLLASAPPAALVTHMPWLAWAADDIARADGKDAGAAVLREMRSQVWQAQIGPELAKAEGADLEGALLFGAGVQARRSIGWQTARPVAAIARMLGREDMTSKDERMGEIVQLVKSLRFLRQLTMDESSVWNSQDPERVLWGVRNGPWDGRLSIEASVMTLLAVDESVKALESLK
jgi:hypothetical protein